jgi:hypothetical protein
MIGSIGSFNRDCRYCNRPVTMRLVWYGWYGRWHAFERVIPNRHYCDAYRALHAQFQLERGVLPAFERRAKGKRPSGLPLEAIAKVVVLIVILAAACFWLLHQEWWYEIAGLLTSE